MVRKTILLITSSLMLGASLGYAQASSTCGDLDGNGKVVASDALLLLRFAVGQDVEVLCPSIGALCWDGNLNGVCDPEDDLNGDEFCDVLDCPGAPGAPGP